MTIEIIGNEITVEETEETEETFKFSFEEGNCSSVRKIIEKWRQLVNHP